MTIGSRNPLKDQVAIVGIGSAPYGRDLRRTPLSLGLEAARNAIEDAGIDKTLIDGVCGSGARPQQTHGAGFLSVQGALGIPEANWVMNSGLGACFVYSAQAVFSGLCDYVLIVQAYQRGLGQSTSAANDPFRARAAAVGGAGRYPVGQYAESWIHSGEPYAAWLNKYMHDYGATRETFGRIAINNRQWASKNPAAVLRRPITMEDYLNARMIWEPFGVLDMDLPVDAAEAMVLTTAERAKDLAHKPVYVHAMSFGGTRVGEYYENGIAWDQTCPWIALRGLWSRSDLGCADIDLFYPYDGFTATALCHIEAAGFCGAGEATALFQDSWDDENNILKLNGGRTQVSTNGGSLSHGRTGGFNYYTEAVIQLRGDAGPDRQVAGAGTALCSIGSFYHDPAAVVLRSDG